MAAAFLALTLLPTARAASEAPATLASIVASDNVFRTDTGGAAGVTIAAGGHVSFSYPSGASRHNVVFPGARPTVCGTADGPEATTAALPTVPTAPSWDGGCDFDVAGTYAFVCGLHSSMTGSVTVVQTGASAPPPPSPGPDTVPVTPAAGGPAATGLLVATHQRGLGVRGSVQVPRAGSRLLARAFARRKALFAGSRSLLKVQVGRQLRSPVGGARVTFSAALNAAARRVLRRNGRLLITLRLEIAPAAGKAYTATRTVILRPPQVPRRAHRR